jgi:hypothetical protein
VDEAEESSQKTEGYDTASQTSSQVDVAEVSSQKTEDYNVCKLLHFLLQQIQAALFLIAELR